MQPGLFQPVAILLSVLCGVTTLPLVLPEGLLPLSGEAVAFSPDGTLVAAAVFTSHKTVGYRSSVVVRGTSAATRPVWEREFASVVDRLDWSRDGARLLIHDSSETWLVNLTHPEQDCRVPGFRSFTGWESANRWATVSSEQAASVVQVYNLDCQEVARHAILHPVRDVAVDPVHSRWAFRRPVGPMELVQAEGWKSLATIEVNQDVRTVAFLDHGRRLCYGSSSMYDPVRVACWDLEQEWPVLVNDYRAKRRALAIVGASQNGSVLAFRNYGYSLGDYLDFPSDGKPSKVVLWDATTGKVLDTFSPPGGARLAVSDDGRLVAIGFGDKVEIRELPPRVVAAHAPDVTFRVTAGEAASAVVLVDDVEHDLGPGLFGRPVHSVRIGD